MRLPLVGSLAVIAGPLACLTTGCGSQAGSGVLDLGSDGSGVADSSVTSERDGGGSAGGNGNGTSGFVMADASASSLDGGGLCDLGSAGNVGTAADPNLFGEVVYYEDGGPLPAGRYRATYIGGCMEFDFLEGWQAQATSPAGFWFVGDTSDDRIVQPPGLPTQYPQFGGCVAANLAAVAPAEFEFDGGKIGVWLNDSFYPDNVEGPDGGNPRWTLQLLETCPPDLAPK